MVRAPAKTRSIDDMGPNTRRQDRRATRGIGSVRSLAGAAIASLILMAAAAAQTVPPETAARITALGRQADALTREARYA